MNIQQAQGPGEADIHALHYTLHELRHRRGGWQVTPGIDFTWVSGGAGISGRPGGGSTPPFKGWGWDPPNPP